MSINLGRSLIFRTGLAMAGITLLAIFTMVSSVIIADTARGDAAAINLAGSLRMQAYRMGSHIQNPDHDRAKALLARDTRAFDASLHDTTLSSVIPSAPDNPLAESYREVIAHWDNRLKPSVEQYPESPLAARQQYLADVDTFVAEVDHMVHQLQQEAEGKIQLLRLIQGIALFLTLALVFFTMYKLLLDVIPPLRDLLAAVDDARQGNLSTRTTYQSQDELGLLSRTFNEMAESLSRMYAELEQRVADRTAELQRSNLSLEVLYETANRLGRSPPNDVMAYRPILERLEQATGLGPVTLCLAHPGQASAFSQIATRDRRPAQCTAPDCAGCFEAAMHGRVPTVPDAQVIPIMENDQRFGVLVVERGAREPGALATQPDRSRRRPYRHLPQPGPAGRTASPSVPDRGTHGDRPGTARFPGSVALLPQDPGRPPAENHRRGEGRRRRNRQRIARGAELRLSAATGIAHDLPLANERAGPGTRTAQDHP